MSFFKRLTNLGKGVWSVNTGGRDPEEAARIRALQEEMAAHQPSSTRASATRSSATRSSTGPAQTADPQLRLDALAQALRQGSLTREEYDAACEKIITQLDGHEPEEAPAETGPDDAGAADAGSGDGGPIKRTL